MKEHQCFSSPRQTHNRKTRTETKRNKDRSAYNSTSLSIETMVDRSPFGGGGRSYSEGDRHPDEAIDLYETSREREHYDEQANLYAIILATEHLERAYARDAIEPKEYTTQCKKLISQFKLAERVLRNEMTTETFMQLYQMDCPRATERLLKMGVPEPLRGGADEANHAVTVAETGTNNIPIALFLCRFALSCGLDCEFF